MPCDYKKYPANWHSEIRPRILERDGHRCKWCDILNYSLGWREEDGTWHLVMINKSWRDANDFRRRLRPLSDRKLIVIVLTVAHIHDDDPANCADDNLAALCQQCHNRHDAKARQERRRQRICKSV